MSDSVRPHRRQPTRLQRPWDSPGKNTVVGCHFLLQCMKVKTENEVAQSCPTLSDAMDCSPPGSSVHGIFQARVREWSAVVFSIWNNELVQNWERWTSGYILSPCLFNLYAEYIMWNVRLDEAQVGIKIARRNINNLRYHHYGRKQRRNKEPLDEGERGEWKSWLKTQHSKEKGHGIWYHHFIANRRGKSGSSDRFYFLGLRHHCGQWLQLWN